MAAQVLGAQPQTFGVCPPPQVSGGLQVPHTSVPPHPSDTLPQVAPRSAQVFGLHPQALGTSAPPQVSGAVQPPQSRITPQPSESLPHSAPRSAQVRAGQGKLLQVLVPLGPPQYWSSGQVPQSTTAPQPSSARPHSAPRFTHVFGAHAPESGSPSPVFRSSRFWLRLQPPIRVQTSPTNESQATRTLVVAIHPE